MIKKMIGGLALASALALSATAQTTAPTKPTTATSTPAHTKHVKQKAMMPKDDPSIQKCIEDKFAAAPVIKDEGLNATVSGGVATLTGTAKNGGSKGGAHNIAKSCGATKIVNNITTLKATKPAKTKAKTKTTTTTTKATTPTTAQP